MKVKEQPYIDYSMATNLTRLYDFINTANQMRGDMLRQLDYLGKHLQIVQAQIIDAKNLFAAVSDPNTTAGNFNNDIEALWSYAWEAGLSHTLFEKLKDRQFRSRFTGGIMPVVLKEEIEDRYEE